jgi:hypothetical protein
MKIIQAHWELRNLGVSCKEINIDINDDINMVDDILTDKLTQYLVLKIPSPRADIITLASQRGYVFVEGVSSVSKKLHQLAVPSVTARLLTGIQHQEFNEADFETLWIEIEKGMFNTDRISRDEAFGPKLAAKRYISWISTEHENGAGVYKLLHKNQSFGFFTLKNLGNGVYYPFLAGIYSGFRNHGVGLAMAYQPLIATKSLGGTSVSTWVSTNNIPSIRIHVSLGFSFDSISYVFVRHNNPE